MRLDKFLSNTLEYSRSEIKNIIKRGKVTVDGITVKDSSFIIKDIDNNIVCLNGEKIAYNKYRYFVLNKPSGVVSATKDNVYKTVIDIVDKSHKKLNLFPVGRLDKDTEGLLILTNNGEFAHNSLSPKKHVVKKYFVNVLGKLNEDDVKAFFDGIIIDKYTKLKSAKLEIIKTDDISKCYVSISEGKFHQVKKMFIARGKKVVYLKRVSFGNFDLPNDLETGQYRELTKEEIETLIGGKNE